MIKKMDKEMNSKRTGSVILIFIIGIIIGFGSFWCWNSFVVKKVSPVTPQVDQVQVKDLIAKVGKLIILPTGEDPVIATINDAVSLVKDQPFYKGSQNGDVVLVYQKAAKAIVYSPSKNMIVNVGPVVLQNQASTATTTSSTKK